MVREHGSLTKDAETNEAAWEAARGAAVGGAKVCFACLYVLLQQRWGCWLGLCCIFLLGLLGEACVLLEFVISRTLCGLIGGCCTPDQLVEEGVRRRIVGMIWL